MATIRFEKDADTGLIKSRRVAILGYGSQGHAHALNLKDNGVDVVVGLHAGSKSRAKAEQAGLTVMSVAEASAWADVIMLLVPDTTQASLYKESIEPHLGPGKTLLFAHGFNIRFEQIVPPTNVDVSMVAPKGPGPRLRETFLEGGGLPALIAVHQDASGQADAVALSYAAGIGCARIGVLSTTFAEEAETDLFGEQAVLCGGAAELVKAGFNTLVEAGYQPEVAYFECLHELKLIVDLMYRGGLNYMRHTISDTAEWGDYVSGPRIIGDASREEMKKVLREIQDGTFAKKWVKENAEGRPNYKAKQLTEQDQQLEKVGAALRKMMPFVDPITVKPSDS
jgi:ketol-acid reductoisomerase